MVFPTEFGKERSDTGGDRRFPDTALAQDADFVDAMKGGPDGCFELRLLELRGRGAQLDKAKSGQLQDASPSAVRELRGGRRDGRGAGPGARRGRGD
jgi:hypothetical protein